jgi:lipoprotein LprG
VRKIALTGAALALALCGCSGSDDSKTDDQSTDERLADAKTSFDDAEYIGFTMATDDLPDGVDGLTRAEGTGTHAPAFTGNVDVQTSIAISAELIAVDGKVYAELPIVGWQDIDPADYGAPDPATLMSTDGGISSLFTATEDAAEGDSKRDGSEVLTTIDGTIPGADVQAIFPSAGTDDFDVSYTLTDDNDIKAISVTGPFYGDAGDVTYDLDFDLDADAVEIEAP